MYKVVSSAAANYGRSLVMTECYGAIDLPVPNLYREAMDQFAKGVNLMVPHAVWYQTEAITFPPELSYRTERYASELPRYNQYIGRLQRVLQQGRPVVDIAVLYPIHGLQSGYYFGPGEPYQGGVIPPWADYMDVGERLSLDLRHDFTYLHPETLDARCQVAGGRLVQQAPACPQQYRLVILPGTDTISAANLAQLKAYYEQGGHLIATTRLPHQSAEFGRHDDVRAMIRDVFGTAPTAPGGGDPDAASQRPVVNRHANGGTAQFVASPSAAALQAAISQALPQPDVAWQDPPTVSGGHVSYLHKELEGRHVWFFANSSDTPVDTRVALRGVFALERWDPHTGHIEPCPAAASQDRTIVRLQLAPVTSVLLVSVP